MRTESENGRRDEGAGAHRARAASLFCALLVTVPLTAQSTAPDGEGTTEQEESPRPSFYQEIDVQERVDDLTGLAEAASEGATGAEDLARRPIFRSGEVVETVPGVIATQHSGGGKANQYFLRGFNLDHGTDFSVAVAGMPVNMPSHGHGQGYADLNFLIPELIERVRFKKGTYDAESGDFSAAGAVDVALKRSLDRGLIGLTGGGYDFGRLLMADSVETLGGDLLGALEMYGYDGPWERGDDYDRVNGIVRFSRGDASRGGSLTAMGYDGDWLATDQIPRRAVDGGQIDRFGLIDPGPRGATERYSLSGDLHRGDDASLTRLQAYALSYRFRLVSQFTYFLDDAERGDQFEQIDDRWVLGLHSSHQRQLELGGLPIEGTVGLELRYDEIDNGLFRTEELARFDTVRQDSIRLLAGGAYAESAVRWTDTFRTTFGLRADLYEAEVVSDLAANSGDVSDAIVSPKLAAVFGPWNDTEFYVNWGLGFHSNDARGATIRVDPVTGEAARRVEPLVRADGAELGVRTTVIDGLQSTLSVFGLELDSELVFVGDGGATEASRPSRRTGVEWTNYFQALPWLALDLDVAFTDSEFTDDDPAGERIPGALEHVVALGVTVHRLAGWSGGLRLRYFSDYPLIEDGSVRAGSTAVLNARVGYDFPNGLSLVLDGFNLLDRDDADIAYFYASRLPGETAEGVEDIHFHPVERPAARLSLQWTF